MGTKFTRRARGLLACLTLVALTGMVPVVSAAAEPATAPADVEKVAIPAGAAVPPPPPAPVGRDGVRMLGAWWGPFTYRNVHSGKCLDVSSAGTGATVVQDQCWAGDPAQAWYEWQYMGDGFVSYFMLGNSAAGGCATGINERQALWIQGCGEIEPQTWWQTSDRLDVYNNQMTWLCMEVGGWSKANGAIVMTWDCLGNPNQLWNQFGWH